MTELFAGATKLLASVGKERWRCRGSCWRYLLPRRRRGRCLLGCVSWVGRSSSGGSHCSAAPGSRALGRFGTTADGNIRAPCMIRGVRAAKGAPSWQDLRAVYSQTAVCRAFRIHGAHILPKPAHFGCMARESCHELAIFPSEAAFGMHGAQNLPRIDARERTVVKSCHGLTLGDAPREYIATASRPRTHSRRSCHGRTTGFAPHQITAALPAKKRRRRQDLENAPARSTKDRVLARLGRAAGTARCSAIAEHSGMQRGEISPWPITRPETKEGEHFARLLLLFCLRLEWPSGPSR